MSSLELRIPPLVVLAIAAGVMWLVATFMPLWAVSVPARSLVAGATAIAGVLVCAVGLVQFRRSGTTVNPLTPEASSALVTTGVYRLTRNPMYLGFALLLLSLVVLLESLLNVAVLVAFVMYVTRFQIAPEEAALKARFGSAFTAYARDVRRWL